jgi:hypothetical protein
MWMDLLCAGKQEHHNYTYIVVGNLEGVRGQTVFAGGTPLASAVLPGSGLSSGA